MAQNGAEPTELSDELELVPEEFRHEFQNQNQEDEITQRFLLDFQRLEREAVRGGMHVTNCEPPVDKRFVFVTFYTYADKKVVKMYLDQRYAKDQVAQKAAELLPTIQWKIYSGNQHRADFEFLTSSHVWDSIKISPICRFNYLLVRLERLHPIRADYHDARCDECRQDIIGHRYKCTECADFDICQKCEARSVHPEHAMLRIVNKGITRIPNYITVNAPRFVFRGY